LVLILINERRFTEVCPATDPTLLGLNIVLETGIKETLPWPNCSTYPKNVDCVAGLGFVAPLTTGTLYNPSNTPAAGTQTPFDEPGTATAPPSGSVFTWYTYQSSYRMLLLRWRRRRVLLQLNQLLRRRGVE
jgi:hypothetical protein